MHDTAADCGAPVDYVAAALIGVGSAVIGNARVGPLGEGERVRQGSVGNL